MVALVLVAAFETGRVSAQSVASLMTTTSARSNSPDGEANASTNLRITDGSGTAIAIADSDVYQVAKSEIIEIFKTVEREAPEPASLPVDKDAYCPAVSAFIDEQAQAVALAAARVTVDVQTEIIIDGEGDGCANADASGEAFAVAVADLLVDAFVAAVNDLDDASANAILNAKSSGFAAAFANASAFACLNGPGEAVAQQIVMAEAIVRPIATILVFLDAFVDCSGFTDSFAEAEVGADLVDDVEITSEAISRAVGIANAGTDAGGRAITGNICNDAPFEICCSGLRNRRLNDGDTCFCNSSARNNRLTKCMATKRIIGEGVIFEDQNSDFACACPQD